MKKVILALAVLVALQANAQTPNAASGRVQSVQVPENVTPVTTINGICATPATGCAVGQWVTEKANGRSSFGAQIITANFTGTLKPFISQDNGATWTQARLRQSFASLVSNSSSTTQVAYSAATLQDNWTIVFPGPVTDVAVISTAAVTNTATVSIVGSNETSNLLPDLASLKGTQAPVGLGTQDLKDAGRTYVALSADGVTPAIAETVITFTKTVADTQTAAQTSYTITTGKTLRIQAICPSITAGAAANRVRVALRMNTGGACIAGSNILVPVAELAPGYGTAAASEGGVFGGCMMIPDGLEISGNGTKAICLTENAVAASGTLTVNLVAYEY